MDFSSQLDQPLFHDLRATAAEMGLRAFVIGGFVRDLVLNRPSKDVDVVVEGRGIAMAEAFAKRCANGQFSFFENFGTAMVMHGEWQVEFVGARKESYSRDSRKPKVEEGTLADDQIRRDFTINAMSISLNDDDFGTLHDPFNGLADLEAGIIRTPTDPNITFSDDPLRMMRAVRFATQLDFMIEEKTYQALSDNRERLPIISMERVTEELNKIVMTKLPSRGFRILFNTGLLQMFFPEMVRLHGVDFVNGRGHKDNFYHTLQVLDNLCATSDDLWLRWAAILHDIAKPATKRYYPKQGWTFHGHEDLGAKWVPRIFKDFRLPLDGKMKFVQKMVQLHLRPIALVDDGVTDSAVRRLIVDADEDLEALMKLCRADITTRNADRMERILRNFDNVQRKIEEVMDRDQLRNWQPPVTGEMIMELFKIPPSRMVGDIKNAVREAIMEGEIPNAYEPAMAFAKAYGERLIERSSNSN